MNSEYLYQDTKLPSFLQFPEFLLQMSISQTAKIVYLVLYNRCRLSMQNEWADEFGHIYVIFPVAKLAMRIGKSESTVKAGLKELCEAGLLEKRSGGFSKPNYLLVKYIPEDRIIDRMKESSLGDAENNTAAVQKTDPVADGFPPGSKVMIHSNLNKSSGETNRTARGRYENIYLSDEELEELRNEFPATLDRYLEELSEYAASTGRTYVNYAATIRRWAANDRRHGSGRIIENYSYNEEESF